MVVVEVVDVVVLFAAVDVVVDVVVAAVAVVVVAVIVVVVVVADDVELFVWLQPKNIKRTNPNKKNNNPAFFFISTIIQLWTHNARISLKNTINITEEHQWRESVTR